MSDYMTYTERQEKRRYNKWKKKQKQRIMGLLATSGLRIGKKRKIVKSVMKEQPSLKKVKTGLVRLIINSQH